MPRQVPSYEECQALVRALSEGACFVKKAAPVPPAGYRIKGAAEPATEEQRKVWLTVGAGWRQTAIETDAEWAGSRPARYGDFQK